MAQFVQNHWLTLVQNRWLTLVQIIQYLHNNPVADGLVEEAEHYLYSSAKDYAGIKGLLDIVLIL